MVDCSVGGGEVPLLDVNKVFMTFLVNSASLVYPFSLDNDSTWRDVVAGAIGTAFFEVRYILKHSNASKSKVFGIPLEGNVTC
jgi:hypothetical protein